MSAIGTLGRPVLASCPIHCRETSSGFDKRAETRFVSPGTVLPPAGNARNDQARIGLTENAPTEAITFQDARHEPFQKEHRNAEAGAAAVAYPPAPGC